MKTIITMLKAILLWGTALAITSFLCGGCEYLMSNGYVIEAILWLLIDIAAVLACAKLSIRDIYVISGHHFIRRLLKV